MGTTPPGLFALHVVPGAAMRAVALIAVVSALLSRAVAPALPGTAAGIEGWITTSRLLAAVTSAHFVVLAAALLVWLALGALVTAELPPLVRVAAFPVSSAIIVMSISAILSTITPRWLLWTGTLSGLMAVAAAPRAIAMPRSRAAGFVLAIAGLSAFVEAIARVLAIRASERALAGWFLGAQAIATVSFVLELLAVLVLGLWVGGRRPKTMAVGAVAVALVAGIVTTVGARGTLVDAASLEVFVARAFGELTRHPRPLVPLAVLHAVEVSRFVLVTAALLVPGRSAAAATALALACLAIGNADIPACSVMLTLAALVALLESFATRRGERTPQEATSLPRAVTDAAEATISAAPTVHEEVGDAPSPEHDPGLPPVSDEPGEPAREDGRGATAPPEPPLSVAAGERVVDGAPVSWIPTPA